MFFNLFLMKKKVNIFKVEVFFLYCFNMVLNFKGKIKILFVSVIVEVCDFRYWLVVVVFMLVLLIFIEIM